jgi:thiamine kinase-like enzyme
MDKDYFQKIISNDFISNSNFKFEKITGTNQLTKTFIVTDLKTNKDYFYKQLKNKSIDEFKIINNLIKKLNKDSNNFKTPGLYYSHFDTKTNLAHQFFEFIENDNLDKNSNEYLTNNIDKIVNLINSFNQISKKESTSLIQGLNLDIIKVQNRIKKKLVDIPQNLLKIFNEELKYDYSAGYLIINDINPSNFLYKKNEIYLIDYDDIKLGTFEFDLSKIYVNLFFENSQTKDSFNNFSKVLKSSNIGHIKYITLLNAIILNLIEKISMDYLQLKKLNQNMLNRLIEIKTNKQKYLEILTGENI